LIRLLSVQVGKPRVIFERNPWASAFFKTPVQGPVWLRATNLDGDEQADLRVHGGPDKAVCVYSADHLDAWRRELGLADMTYGAFGENFSITGQTEPDVCIGDTYRLGGTIVEVSQPRGPCWKLGRRWNMTDLPKRVLEAGRTGWYVRVKQEGQVEAGQDLVLIDRPYPQWTIPRTNELAYRKRAEIDLDAVAALAACEALAQSWRASLAKKVESDTDIDE
jgi:MOSC domain-containing protein YiiM